MFTGISAGNLLLYPRGDSFPRFHGYIRGKSSHVPARQLFSAFPRVYPRDFFPCTRAVALFCASTGISARNLFLYPRGGVFPRFNGYIRAKSSPVPARQLFSALPRVYPREIFPCTRAVALFRFSTGISAGFLSLYPRGLFTAGQNTSAAVCRRRYLVSERNPSIRCVCNQTRVCRRKGSGRRLSKRECAGGSVLAGDIRRKCSGRRHPTEGFRPAVTCRSGVSVDLQVYRHYRVQNRGCCPPR